MGSFFRMLPMGALSAMVTLSVGCDSSVAEPLDENQNDGDAEKGDGDSENGGQGGALPEAGPPLPAEPPPGYPVGPYGAGNPAVGEVLENLTFFGFPRIGDDVLVGTGEPTTMTLASLRDEGAHFALIHTATMWCPSCRAAADDLAARGDELSNLGALIIELVLENTHSVDPAASDLISWAIGSDLTVTTVGPGDDRTKLVFPSREYVYIVELETMEVVWSEQALFSTPTVTEDGIEALLAHIDP